MRFYTVLVLVAVAAPATAQQLVYAPAGHYELCRIAYTSTAGTAALRMTAIDAKTDPKWNPHFGVMLTDQYRNALYKVTLSARVDPLRLTDAQQLFAVTSNGKEVGHAVNIHPEFASRENLTVDFELEWRESGLVHVSLNGKSLGFVQTSSQHQQWNLFLSGMTVRVSSRDADFSDCKE